MPSPRQVGRLPATLVVDRRGEGHPHRGAPDGRRVRGGCEAAAGGTPVMARPRPTRKSCFHKGAENLAGTLIAHADVR